MDQHTSSGAALRIEKMSISEALSREVSDAIRQRRQPKAREEILSGFTPEEVAAWHDEQARQEERWRLDQEAKEAQKRTAELERVIMRSGIPKRYRECRFSSLQRHLNPEAFDVCQGFVDGAEGEWRGHRGLILKGPPGTGKTSLAVASLLRLVEDHQPAPIRFLSLSMMLQKARESFANNGPGWSVEDAISGRLVVIDDLGRQRPTEWVAETIYTLIGQLYDNNTRVIITTNATKQQWEEWLDEAVRSRITEMCFPLVLAGQDLRTSRPTPTARESIR